MTIRRSIVALLISLFATSAVSGSRVRDPIGEKAFFELDKSSKRTSSIVRGGEAIARVVGEASGAAEPSFEVAIDYEIDASLFGSYGGQEVFPVPEIYFEESFLETLRRDKRYEAPDFKVRHLGYRDAVNQDGRRSARCDILQFYDIDSQATGTWIALLGLSPKADAVGEVEDVEILAHIKTGIPVLGAVKLDISGRYNGMPLKAGFDYRP